MHAGVQADLRAFHAYGLHGCTVFAALTAQNPFGVTAIHGVPADFVAAHAEALARQIHETCGCAVLVKGGHGAGASAVDVLFDGRDVQTFALPWVADPVSTHGTGCSLAASSASPRASRNAEIAFSFAAGAGIWYNNRQ